MATGRDDRGQGRRIATHLAAFTVGAIVATSVVSHAVPGKSAALTRDRYAALDTFAQALSYVANGYVDDVDERKLIYGAIKGLVTSLDPHSNFLPPRSYQRLREDTEGEFGGVGLSLGEGQGDDPTPRVTAVVRGAPAQRAGMKVGDRVSKIDGKPTVVAHETNPKLRRARPETAESLLRGAVGTRVTLDVVSSGKQPREVVLVRERIKVPSIHSTTFGAVAYVALKKFQDATTVDLRETLVTLKKGGHLRALILDLRGNPGGLLDQGISVADLFVDKGLLVTVLSRSGQRREVERAHRPGSWTGFPMVVLIDENTASAAEIVAGALKENRRAHLVGVPSYGKGTVQTFLDLKDGSGLKLTTSRYYLPSGTSLEGVGIGPHEEVESEGEVVVAGGGRPAPKAAAEFSGLPAARRERLLADRQLAAAYRHLARTLGQGGKR